MEGKFSLSAPDTHCDFWGGPLSTQLLLDLEIPLWLLEGSSGHSEISTGPSSGNQAWLFDFSQPQRKPELMDPIEKQLRFSLSFNVSFLTKEQFEICEYAEKIINICV